MTREPGNVPPRPTDISTDPPPAAQAPRKTPPVDEVAQAKARLLAATEKHGDADMLNPSRKLNDFLRDHPYVAAGAALGAGLLFARVKVLRKMAVVGGTWAAKRYLARYLSQMTR